MTCLVAIRKNNEVTVGGDSAESDHWTVSVREDPKFFARGPYIIGFAGSIRIGQIVRFKMRMPKPRQTDLRNSDTMLKFMSTRFIDELTIAINENGSLVVSEEDGNNMASNSGLIVCIAGHMFMVQSDMAVCTTTKDYIAMGSGDNFALGSLYATENSRQSSATRVLKALEAAAEFSTTVSGPFHLFSSKWNARDVTDVTIKRIN